MPPPTARLRILHLFLLLLVVEALHACGSDPSKEAPPIGVDVKHVWKQRRVGGRVDADFKPIRIETFYDPSIKTSAGGLSDRDIKDINKFVIYATKKYKTYLEVASLNSPDLKIEGCNMINFNKKMGDNDFMLKVLAEPCPNPETLATAGTCSDVESLYVNKDNKERKYEGFAGRPLAGQLKICTGAFLNRTKRVDDDAWKSTILHEIGHALAFGPDLYARFHDGTKLYDKGQLIFTRPDTTGCQDEACLYEIPGLVKKVKRSWKHKTHTVDRYVYMLITPKAKQEARNYFNCQSLEGVELENQGAQGNTFAHLEKRIYEHDTMTSTRTSYNVWSRITLAIMADSGWYKVNLNEADPMHYGEGKECEFVMKSCKEYVDMKGPANSYPFCSSSEEERCSDDRLSIEKCDFDQHPMKPNEVIPPIYTYFPNGRPGHTALAPADYCPLYTTILQGNKDTKCNVPNLNAVLNANASTEDETARWNRKGKLEIYSKTAKCFQVGGERKVTAKTHFLHMKMKHGCFENKCEDGSLWIKTARSKFYRCYYDGQTIHVAKRLIEEKATTRFTITCPKCSDLCTGANFVCKNRKSSAPARVGDRDREKSGSTKTISVIISLFLFTIV